MTTNDRPRLAAVELLLRQRLHSLFFDVNKLKLDRTVIYKSYRKYCMETNQTVAGLSYSLRDGFTIMSADGTGGFIVLYNDEVRSLRRQNFTLAHELGHIYLGHKDDGEKNEAEANRFASELLMPSILVRELAVRYKRPLLPVDLQEVFSVSSQAAVRKLYNIGIADSDKDKELLKKFGTLLPNPGEPHVNL